MGSVIQYQNLSCSTSLTSKGLRPRLLTNVEAFSLQHLPDFKGIETQELPLESAHPACSTSLTSKGLRLLRPFLVLNLLDLQHLPDFKGIETFPAFLL